MFKFWQCQYGRSFHCEDSSLYAYHDLYSLSGSRIVWWNPYRQLVTRIGGKFAWGGPIAISVLVNLNKKWKKKKLYDPFPNLQLESWSISEREREREIKIKNKGDHIGLYTNICYKEELNCQSNKLGLSKGDLEGCKALLSTLLSGIINFWNINIVIYFINKILSTKI